MKFKYLAAYNPELIKFNLGNTAKSGGYLYIYNNVVITLKYCNGDYNENTLISKQFSGSPKTLAQKLCDYILELDFVDSATVDLSKTNPIVKYTVNVDRWFMEMDKGNNIYIFGSSINNLTLVENINSSQIKLNKYSLDSSIPVDLSSEYRLQNVRTGQNIEYNNLTINNYSVGNVGKFTVIPSKLSGKDLLQRVLSDNNIISVETDKIVVSVLDTGVTPTFKCAINNDSNYWSDLTLDIVDIKYRNGIVDYTLSLNLINFITEELYIYIEYTNKADNPHYKSAYYRFSKTLGSNSLYKEDYITIRYLNKYGGWSYFIVVDNSHSSSIDDTEKYVGYSDFVPVNKILNVSVKHIRKFHIWCDSYDIGILRELQESKEIYANDKLIELTKMDIEDSSANLSEVNIEYNYIEENI